MLLMAFTEWLSRNLDKPTGTRLAYAIYAEYAGQTSVVLIFQAPTANINACTKRLSLRRSSGNFSRKR
jgi:hypothetical protein